MPLIHEVAVGRVHPRTVSSPIAPLRRCLPVPALGSLGYRPHPEDPRNPEGPVGYEYLVLNPGSVAAEPGPRLRITSTPSGAWTMRCACARPWRCLAPGHEPGPRPPQGILTVAIVGGGATGVEVAAEVAALFDYLGKRSHRRPSEEPRVVLLRLRTG